jgi:hypothetical protein
MLIRSMSGGSMSDESTQEILGAIQTDPTAGADGFARRLGRDLVKREQPHGTAQDNLQREVKEAIATLTERVASTRDTMGAGHSAVLSELGTLRRAMDRYHSQSCAHADMLAAVERRQTELLVTLGSIRQQLEALAIDVAAAVRPPWWQRWLSGR